MQYLSHYLNQETTPCYGGNADDLKISPASCMCNGDSANSLRIELKNHVGTHIDLPKHFDDNGITLESYSADFWSFKSPQLLEIPCEPNYLITIDDLKNKINKETDFLILKTNFEQFRSQKIYWNNNPGVNIDVGIWLRKNFPQLRIIGFDFISLSSYQNRMIGRQAHKEFLSSSFEGSPILIIEDMKLSHLSSSPKTITVAPLLVEGADGVPVTVFAD